MEGTMGVQQDTELFLGGVVGGVGKFGRAKKGSCSAKCLGQKVVVEYAHEKTNMVQGLCCEMR